MIILFLLHNDQGESQNNFLAFKKRKTLRFDSMGLNNEMGND